MLNQCLDHTVEPKQTQNPTSSKRKDNIRTERLKGPTAFVHAVVHVSLKNTHVHASATRFELFPTHSISLAAAPPTLVSRRHHHQNKTNGYTGCCYKLASHWMRRRRS